LEQDKYSKFKENSTYLSFSPIVLIPNCATESLGSNMPAPSNLAIATKSVQRLLKEESYYRTELVKQQARVQQLDEEAKVGGPDLDPNAEYVLKQEVSTCIPPHLRLW
jgi:hypothetical protein